MHCSSCNHPNPDENRFCGNCGMPLKPSAGLRSKAQTTVDYFLRVAREHPDGERPENPVSPDATYDTQTPPNDEVARQNADLTEIERARNVAEFRDLRPLSGDPSETPSRETSYPRGAYDAADLRYDPHLEPELIEFDRQIPLIADPGTDRRRSRPEWHFREKSTAATAGNSRESVPSGSSPQVLAVSHGHEENRGDIVRTASATHTGDVSVAKSFLDLSGHGRNTRSSLHGPSFLGLNSDGDVQYLDVDEEVSHTRRNVALLFLLVLIALGAVQWRSIRDLGLRYAGNIHLPGKSNVAVKPPETQPAGATQGATTTPAANGQPEIITEPTQNPNAARNTGNTKTPGTPTPGDSANSVANNPGTQPNADNKSGNSEIASKGDGSHLPQGEPNDDKADADSADTSGANAGDAAKAGRGSSARRDAPSPDSSRPDPGQAELAQAAAAANPASAATWLWKAVAKGSPDAQVRLADLYLEGRGVTQNCEQALVLLRSASGKKYSRARIRLGSLYATGKCVPQDRVAAYHWMSLALDSSPGSQWVEENRQSLWSQMSPEERRLAGAGKL